MSVKPITPVIIDENNPSRDELMGVINKARTLAEKQVIDLVKHVNALINSGDLVKEDILNMLSKHVKPGNFDSPIDTHLKSPKGGHYDSVMAELLAGESVSPQTQEPTFRYLIRSVAIKVANGDIPFEALPTLETHPTLSM